MLVSVAASCRAEQASDHDERPPRIPPKASALMGVESTVNQDGTINRKEITIGHRVEASEPSPAPSSGGLERAKLSASKSDDTATVAAQREQGPPWLWWTIGVLIPIALALLFRSRTHAVEKKRS
jgi:hypothetical protein